MSSDNAIALGDFVITPRGDLARVVRVVGSFLDLRYCAPLQGAQADFTLHARLVVKAEQGQRLPAPVRIQE